MSNNRQATKRSPPSKRGAKKRQNQSSKNSRVQAPRGSANMRALPVAFVRPAQARSPQITGNGRSTTIKHSELVSTIAMTTAQQGVFTQLLRLRINPGSAVTFPWLSNISTAWESFRFKRCSLRYVPRCPTTSSGMILMSPDFDASDSPTALGPVNEGAIYSNVDTIDRPIWDQQSVLHLRTERLNRLYKTHTNMTDGRFANTAQDKKTIDPAQVIICSDASSTAGVAFTFGKLFVDYEVELFEPQDVTDSPYMGGGAGQIVIGSATSPNSPVIAAISQSQEDINSPLNFFTTANGGQPAGTVFPNCTLGVFNRDWQGSINSLISGAGLNIGTDSEMWVGPNTPGVQAPSAANGDVKQHRDDYYRNANGAANIYTNLYNVVGKAGQVLKFTAPVLTNLGAQRWVLGGTSVFSL